MLQAPVQPQPIPSVPAAAADRMLRALRQQTRAAQQAHSSPEVTPADRAAFEQVARLLQQRLDLAEAAAARFHAGDGEPLAETASQLRFLARDLDGYPATPEMETSGRLLVQVAWQIHAASSGHAAAGL